MKKEKNKKVDVTVTFRGRIEVSEEAYETLEKEGIVDTSDIDLPWMDIINLDGEVEFEW